jgi:type IV secretory pathway VirB2 component (pilin)
MSKPSRATVLLILALAAGAAVLLDPGLARAASSAMSQGMPWDGPLTRLTESIKGPVAYAVSLMGIVVAGASLVFGGEINEFVRRVIMLVLVVSLIMFASNILSSLFSAGATIA